MASVAWLLAEAYRSLVYQAEALAECLWSHSEFAKETAATNCTPLKIR